MPIVVQCACGRVLKARDEFAGSRAECPTCGSLVHIPTSSDEAAFTEVERGQAAPTPVKEFFDPPRGGAKPRKPWESSVGGPQASAAGAAPAAATMPAEPPVPVMRRMFEALLDPRSIQWMLMIGGGL